MDEAIWTCQCCNAEWTFDPRVEADAQQLLKREVLQLRKNLQVAVSAITILQKEVTEVLELREWKRLVLQLREKLESLLHENANMKLDQEMNIVKENRELREHLSVAVEALEETTGLRSSICSWCDKAAIPVEEALKKIRGG